MVQKGNLNLNLRKFRFLVRKKMCLVQVSFLHRDRTRMKKNKKVWKRSEMEIREERRGEFRIQSQEDRELVAAAAAASLITENISEHQILDVTNKVMVNRYLRVFTMFYTAW